MAFKEIFIIVALAHVVGGIWVRSCGGKYPQLTFILFQIKNPTEGSKSLIIHSLVHRKRTFSVCLEEPEEKGCCSWRFCRLIACLSK